MSVKRILENQLHLHDEGNPAWGEHTNFYDGQQEARDIARLAEAHKDVKPNPYRFPPKNFCEELKELSKAFVSPKLEEVKRILLDKAALGLKEATLKANEIDTYTTKWLKEQGVIVKENWSGTREDGYSTVEIKW